MGNSLSSTLYRWGKRARLARSTQPLRFKHASRRRYLALARTTQSAHEPEFGQIGYQCFRINPRRLRYLAIHKFAYMIQSLLEGTWVATADLGHLRFAATAAADDLSQFLCKLSGVVALLY
jgi:hypothetical protein